jgi:hypothetical protein
MWSCLARQRTNELLSRTSCQSLAETFENGRRLHFVVRSLYRHGLAAARSRFTVEGDIATAVAVALPTVEQEDRQCLDISKRTVKNHLVLL